MQSRFIFCLITRAKIVIYAYLAAAVLICAGCGRKEEAVFIPAESADESAGLSGSGPETADPVDGTDTATAVDGTDTAVDNRQSQMICVFVCGAVINEGVYELPMGSRVIDAVNAAGGYSEVADTNYVNQALYVTDTQRVEIPTREEAEKLRKAGDISASLESVSEDKGGQAGTSGRVNINTAGRDELMTLPGIGENKASKIIEYRESHGRFGTEEEIMNVSGIGSSVYDRMKDLITVE